MRWLALRVDGCMAAKTIELCFLYCQVQLLSRKSPLSYNLMYFTGVPWVQRQFVYSGNVQFSLLVIKLQVFLIGLHIAKLEMWANAQRDGRPAEYRWRPLFNAAKFGWRPLLECRTCSNDAKKRKPLKFAGVPQTRQQISAVSKPKFTILSGHVEEVLLFNKFFLLSIHALVPKIQPDKVVRWCQNGDFLGPVFPASRAQHSSDLHSKFALGPHHV